MHPLHTPEMVCDHVRNTGEYFDPDRCTGRSTVLALNFLAQAIRQPERPVKIVDHHGTRYANEELRRIMQDMVIRLGFMHMVFTADTVKFTRHVGFSQTPPSTPPIPVYPTGPQSYVGPGYKTRD